MLALVGQLDGLVLFDQVALVAGVSSVMATRTGMAGAEKVPF